MPAADYKLSLISTPGFDPGWSLHRRPRTGRGVKHLRGRRATSFRTTFLVIDESPGNVWSPFRCTGSQLATAATNNDGSAVSFILQTMGFQSWLLAHLRPVVVGSYRRHHAFESCTPLLQPADTLRTSRWHPDDNNILQPVVLPLEFPLWWSR